MKELGIDHVKVLEGVFLDSNNNNISEQLSIAKEAEVETILLPINLFNKHAVGLILEKRYGDNFNVKYVDSLNNPIPKDLEELVTIQLNIKKSAFVQLKVEKQKYANCGSELIENFIFYLCGERHDQEEAVELHSELVKNSLLESYNIDSCGIDLPSFELSVIGGMEEVV